MLLLLAVPVSFLFLQQVLGDRPSPAARLAGSAAIAIALGGLVYAVHRFGVGVPIAAERPGQHALLSYAQSLGLALAYGVDNLLCIALVLEALAIPERHRDRVLARPLPLAVLATLPLAAALVLVADLPLLVWLPVGAGAALVVAAFVLSREAAPLERRGLVTWLRRELRVTDERHHGRLVLSSWGTWRGSRLLLAIALLEPLEAIASLDSFSAVVGTTREPLVVASAVGASVLLLRAIYPWVARALARGPRRRGALVALWTVNGLLLLSRAPVVERLGSDRPWTVALLAAAAGLMTLWLATRAPFRRVPPRRASSSF